MVPDLPRGVEVTRRVADDGRSWLFVLNHTNAPATVTATGTLLVGGGEARGSVTVAPGAVEVVRERHDA